MNTDIVFILSIIIALVASVIFLKGIITASTSKERLLAFYKYAISIAVFLVCGWGYIFSNNLFWYEQNPASAQIEMTLNAEAVEEPSFLYLLEKLDATATPEDVVAIMGENYEEQKAYSYMIQYDGASDTLNGKQPTSIRFIFNKKRTELLSITWAYQNPTPELFAETLEYLEDNAVGAATASTEKTADWAGLHLEDTGDYLLLQRVF